MLHHDWGFLVGHAIKYIMLLSTTLRPGCVRGTCGRGHTLREMVWLTVVADDAYLGLLHALSQRCTMLYSAMESSPSSILISNSAGWLELCWMVVIVVIISHLAVRVWCIFFLNSECYLQSASSIQVLGAMVANKSMAWCTGMILSLCGVEYELEYGPCTVHIELRVTLP